MALSQLFSSTSMILSTPPSSAKPLWLPELSSSRPAKLNPHTISRYALDDEPKVHGISERSSAMVEDKVLLKALKAITQRYVQIMLKTFMGNCGLTKVCRDSVNK